MKKLFIGLLFSLELFAGALVLQSGSVQAHTEMMMDSEINPLNSKLSAEVSIEGLNFETMSGQFWVDMSLFKSDKEDRDEHMHKSLNSASFKLATFSILSVSKTSEADMYDIAGKLSFHGVEHNLKAKAKITVDAKKISFHATSMINMPDYGIEMPCMVFMCVRDQVDFVVKATFAK
jgi:polyisoprenoid-binding protein YceI